jgi:hypothetical protein
MIGPALAHIEHALFHFETLTFHPDRSEGFPASPVILSVAKDLAIGF